jgi:glycosyltransferase involved in cell wall biosynthesis
MKDYDSQYAGSADRSASDLDFGENSMPVVSIIIPLYNKGPYINRALTSILNQTRQDFEVIVVDDGSTDNGAETVRKMNDPRIRLIQQWNQGVSAARNRGVSESSTDLVAFLDADDEWMPSHLETLIQLRAKYPEAGMYATGYMICMPDGKSRWPDFQDIPASPWEGKISNYFKTSTLGESPVTSSSVGIPKRIFIEAGQFSTGYWYGEDDDLWGKIALKYPVAFSREPGAINHREAINRACSKTPPLYTEEPFVKTARSAISRQEIAPELTGPLSEYIYKKEIHRALNNILAGDGKNARLILKQCKTKWLYRRKVKLYILATLPHRIYLLLQNSKENVDKRLSRM